MYLPSEPDVFPGALSTKQAGFTWSSMLTRQGPLKICLVHSRTQVWLQFTYILTNFPPYS